MSFFSNKKNRKNSEDESTLKSFGATLIETVKVVLISLLIILPIRYFVIQPFNVEGASMQPTFLSGEYLIVDEISYRLNQPQRGEVVVFRYPKDPSQFYIKRIIGLPGETVTIKQGVVSINGVQLSEPYIPAGTFGEWTSDPVTLQSDEYFLMGDNRTNSLDSRYFGPVTRKFIVGRVWLRGWPAERFSFFTSPQY